jgi:sugar O-acyltransferase (sialic acid O-acetyltransferase NeuD family)
MTKKIIIIGAGGQGENISLLIEQIKGWEILGFVDDDINKKGNTLRSYPILGSIQEYFSSLEYDETKNNELNVAFSIGNSQVVNKTVNYLNSLDKNIIFPNLIHPSVSWSEKDVDMGQGNIINAGTVFTTGIKIGDFNYFNRCCSVSHGVTIGNYCFIHSGVHLSGNLKVGDEVWFGVNSTIIQSLNIGKNSLIGAGAVITKDVEENAVMVGNPAKVLRYKE